MSAIQSTIQDLLASIPTLCSLVEKHVERFPGQRQWYDSKFQVLAHSGDFKEVMACLVDVANRVRPFQELILMNER
jgi:hypothetical protein